MTERRRFARGFSLLCALALAMPFASGCHSESAPAPKPAPTRGPVLHFEYESIDGHPVSTELLHGRFTVIGFLTTYDFASQAEARFLAAITKRHSPRVNVVAMVLEQPENKPLVDAFMRTLGLPFPAVMADAATILGNGPFAGLHHVPSVVILDKQGREAFRHIGLFDEASMHAELRELEAADGPPAG